MTDGYPDSKILPDDEIKKFKKNPAFEDQLIFYAVGYGKNFDIRILE